MGRSVLVLGLVLAPVLAGCSGAKGKTPNVGGDGTVAACGAASGRSGVLAKGDGSVLVPDLNYTVLLSDSSDTPAPLPPFGDAQEPTETLTPALNVLSPTSQCPHLMTRVLVQLAVPHNTSIRAVEGYFNGARLPLAMVHGTPDSDLVEEAHNFGPAMIPFNTPLYSLDGIAPGKGTLEIRAYDGAYKEVATYRIPELQVVAPPAPVATSAIAAMPHPRLFLTAARLDHMKAKLAANDAQAARFASQLTRFLGVLDTIPDVTTSAFSNRIYNPAGFIPLLGACYQLNLKTDTPKAMRCAAAARALALQIANRYNGTDAETLFARDTGYDLREGFPLMLYAYDWIYDQLSSGDRQLIATVTTHWVDWYTKDPGVYGKARPVNNYFSPYTQALMMNGVVTAGDNSDGAERSLVTLRDRMTKVMPVANQRACGGDWPEGGNYGPGALRAHMTVLYGLAEVGEDWSAVYDFVQPLGLVARYQITADYTQTLPFGGFSGLVPHKTSPALLAMLTPATDAGAHASTLYRRAAAVANNDFFDASEGDVVFELIFGDLSKQADTSGLPLSCMSPGSGRFFSRSSLDDGAAYLMAAEDMHAYFDHYGYANGDLRFYHGGDCILCASTYRGGAFNGEDVTPAFSTLQANGLVQKYDRNNAVLFSKEGGSYAAIAMRFESAFANDRFDESIFAAADPFDYLIREAVHVRPGVLVVRDLSRRRHASDLLVSRFHLGPSAAASNPSADRYAVGGVTISLASSLAPVISFVDDKDQQGTVVGKQMQETFAASTDPLEIVHVFSDGGVTLVSWSGGVARLSNGQCVSFASGDVTVTSC